MKSGRGKGALIIAGILLLFVTVQTLPVFFIAPLGSRQLSGKVVRVYYQKGDAEGAREIFERLERTCARISASMKPPDTRPIDVYVYHTQQQMAIRGAGYVTLAIEPKGYVGDSRKGSVLIVSPFTPVMGQTHETILQAAIHEYVHALILQVNPGLPYFWQNGLAAYVAGQKPDDAAFLHMSVPSLSDMHTQSGLRFWGMGGYFFSYKYIEYLQDTYGWDKVMDFASGRGVCEAIFGMSEQALYDAWCQAISE
ncbi:MAG: hypothetical protein AB9880_07770 [Christensenellales bacterium]